MDHKKLAHLGLKALKAQSIIGNSGELIQPIEELTVNGKNYQLQLRLIMQPMMDKLYSDVPEIVDEFKVSDALLKIQSDQALGRVEDVIWVVQDLKLAGITYELQAVMTGTRTIEGNLK